GFKLALQTWWAHGALIEGRLADESVFHTAPVEEVRPTRAMAIDVRPRARCLDRLQVGPCHLPIGQCGDGVRPELTDEAPHDDRLADGGELRQNVLIQIGLARRCNRHDRLWGVQRRWPVS